MIRRTALILTALSVLSIPVAAMAEGGHGKHWGYSGAEGFQHWGDLSAEFHACKDGMAQSPIDIREYNATDLPALQPSYHKANLEVINNGHTIQVNAGDSGSLSVDGKTYKLLQFHFHTPSEHYIDGAPYPMELHFVHKSADGTLGVVGVMMQLGAHNKAIDTIWRATQASGGRASISAADLLPSNLDYYKYVGSLTTPPCSEGVQWHVAKNAVEISAVQLHAFQALFSVNARPVQPQNSRKIKGD
ncbi:MAG: carbonate dehydratase [Alphaproteobacteria bacterium]|nr:MAG: carbonate dehydratase [Alphaproteobacteria bacterium]